MYPKKTMNPAKIATETEIWAIYYHFHNIKRLHFSKLYKLTKKNELFTTSFHFVEQTSKFALPIWNLFAFFSVRSIYHLVDVCVLGICTGSPYRRPHLSIIRPQCSFSLWEQSYLKNTQEFTRIT